MRKYSLDSGIISLILDKKEPAYSRYRKVQRSGSHIGISTSVLGEFQAGLKRSATGTENRKKFERFLHEVLVWPFDESAAEVYGVMMAALRDRGRIVPAIDVQTAAIARLLGDCIVVTKDSDFDDIPGIAVENWAVP